MPVHIRYLEAFGFNYVQLQEPFELKELLQRAQTDLAAGVDPGIVAAPMLMDFRSVNLLRFETAELRNLIRQRTKLDVSHTSVPCAYLAGDLGSFGMLRMFAVHAEILGLREEQDTTVTTEVDEAVGWLAERLALPADARQDILRALEAVTFSEDK